MRSGSSPLRLLLLVPVLWAGLGAQAARADEPPPGAKPLPVARTATVRAEDGPVFYVDGPTVIPRGAEITVALDVRIVGINSASLDVQGGLKVHGTQDHWVKIENVDFSPTRAPRKGFHLDMVDLSGCKLVHTDGEPFAGEMTIENATFQRDCALDVRIAAGFLKLMTIESGIPWTIRCVPETQKPGTVEIEVRSSWTREIHLSGAADATLRNAEIRGGLVCEGVTDLTVDGCDLTYDLTIRQGAEDTFKKVVLSKLNFFDGAKLVLDRKASADAKAEKVKVEKPYFGPKKGGGDKPNADELARLIEDGEDDPARKVEARVSNPADKPHLLVNYTDLRLRVPPLR